MHCIAVTVVITIAVISIIRIARTSNTLPFELAGLVSGDCTDFLPANNKHALCLLVSTACMLNRFCFL
jgi:hypothetical protein